MDVDLQCSESNGSARYSLLQLAYKPTLLLENKSLTPLRDVE